MQINRLFEIVYILLDKKNVTAKELGERFNVSTRTIYRDIETLSGAGIPVYMSKGKGGGVRLLDHFVLNKSMLSESEQSEILTALSALQSVGQAEAQTALSKLSGIFGKASQTGLRSISPIGMGLTGNLKPSKRQYSRKRLFPLSITAGVRRKQTASRNPFSCVSM